MGLVELCTNAGIINKINIGGANPAITKTKKGNGAKTIKNIDKIIFCRLNEINSLNPINLVSFVYLNNFLLVRRLGGGWNN